MTRPPPISTLFPYPTLSRSGRSDGAGPPPLRPAGPRARSRPRRGHSPRARRAPPAPGRRPPPRRASGRAERAPGRRPRRSRSRLYAAPRRRPWLGGPRCPAAPSAPTDTRRARRDRLRQHRPGPRAPRGQPRSGCSPPPRGAPAPRSRPSRPLLLTPAPLGAPVALGLRGGGLGRRRRGAGGRAGVVPRQHREIRFHAGVLRPAPAAVLPHPLRGESVAGQVTREPEHGGGIEVRGAVPHDDLELLARLQRL